MSILSNYLRTLGVKSYDELTQEEKKTYAEWESTLNGRQVTSSEVRQFLDLELEEATVKLVTQKLGEREDIFLKMKVEFIRKLTAVLDAPKREKDQVEQLIKNSI